MPDQTPDDVRAAAARDYGQFVAKTAIFVGNARAANPGDPIPASLIEAGVISRDDVVGVNTKTAAAVKDA